MRPLASRAGNLVTATAALGRSGLLRPVSPLALVRGVLAVTRDGLSPAAAYEYAAARFPDAVAVVDDRGTISFAELAASISTLSAALERLGIGSEDRVALLCRNHREFVHVVAAVSALGADVLLLNVSFAAPQLAQVLAEQRATVLVYDEELAGIAQRAPEGITRLVARRADGSSPDPALEELAGGSRSRLRFAMRSPTRYILLTSGTTGHPRGAVRSVPFTLDPVVAVLSRIPLHVRDVVLIASPLFHGWGFAHLAFALGLSESLVLQDRFEPEAVLAAIARHRVRVLVAVPVMLQRLLELPEETRRRNDVSSLEVVAVSGSALPAGLAPRFMDVYGDILYNLYGSTEAAWASIATPADLRAAPQCAGLPALGSSVRVVGDGGSDAAPGQIGRILVRNRLLLGGRSARRPSGGFLDTGDVGRFDEAGRLYVEGRADDMIVSGGENVYPQEVEEVLATHPGIAEAAVAGVPDARFGQRLQATVVLRPGHDLTEDDVRTYVRERLARYKVPRDVRFVKALPRNETGKILRRAPGTTERGARGVSGRR
jgi:acyl-CoA synthetase (AMP-forming)/AMP-acid ligase II